MEPLRQEPETPSITRPTATSLYIPPPATAGGFLEHVLILKLFCCAHYLLFPLHHFLQSNIRVVIPCPADRAFAVLNCGFGAPLNTGHALLALLFPHWFSFFHCDIICRAHLLANTAGSTCILRPEFFICHMDTRH